VTPDLAHYRITVLRHARIEHAFCVCSQDCAVAAATAIGQLLSGARVANVVVTPCLCPLLDKGVSDQPL
jgi:hypothetical protein